MALSSSSFWIFFKNVVLTPRRAFSYPSSLIFGESLSAAGMLVGTSDSEGNVTELPMLKVKLAWEKRLGRDVVDLEDVEDEVAGLMAVEEEAGAENDFVSSGTGGLLSDG